MDANPRESRAALLSTNELGLGAEVESAFAGRYSEITPYILYFHQTAGALTDVHD
jgi:hypothetical protein